MKKIYILLFATTTLSTSCMEWQLIKSKEDSWSYDESATTYPLIVFNQTSSNSQQAYNPITDTNWPVYNKIMDIPYKRDQPTTIVTHPDKLAPVYIPITYKDKERTTSTKKLIKDAEKEPLLQTTTATCPTEPCLRSEALLSHPKPLAEDVTKKGQNRVQPNNIKLMQKIYFDAFELIYALQKIKKINWSTHNRDLTCLIYSMNNARKNDIHEDDMGHFSYTKQTGNCNTEEYTTLFFSCLKQYTSTIKKNGESLPDIETSNQSFAEIFDASPHKQKDYLLHNPVVTSSMFKEYPTFAYLEYVVRHLVRLCGHDTIKHLTSCFYTNQPITLNADSKKSYVDLKNEFYAKAHNLLLNNGNSDNVYEIIEIIDTAKRLHDINHENDLGYGILGFEPTKKITIHLYEYFNSDYSTIPVKNRIALLCSLIEKYNNARLKKITPTFIQHQAYALYKDLNLARPDDCKCYQLNKRHYAFAEYKQLIEDTRRLITADDQSVAQEVAQRYPQKK